MLSPTLGAGKILDVEDMVNCSCYTSVRAEVASQGQAESFLGARPARPVFPAPPLGPPGRWAVESVCLRLIPGEVSSLWKGLSSLQKRGYAGPKFFFPCGQFGRENFWTFLNRRPPTICQARAASLINATRTQPHSFLLSPHLPAWQWHSWDKLVEFLYTEW